MVKEDSGFLPHTATVEEVCSNYGVAHERGLSSEEAAQRLERFGKNELQQEESTPLWKLVLDQFDDLLVKVLLASALFSFVVVLVEEGIDAGVFAFIEPGVILLILIINAIVGVWQESNAEQALEALKRMQSVEAMCLRDGELLPNLAAADLVPGDVVEVRVGDKVPADMRIVELRTTTLAVEEAALTGESKTVLKTEDAIEGDKDTEISSKSNMLFSSTTLAAGTARGVVVETGMRTEIGKIQAAVQQASEEEEKTPLGQKVDQFSEMLSKVIAGICLLVWVMNYTEFFDDDWGFQWKACIYYLKIAVALGVAAIPEGLPAVITLCLALGTRQMVKRNAIVRKLPSVETLGCTTVICSDKTGTLTTNEMVAVRFSVPDKNGALRSYDVAGSSYAPEGDIQDYDGMRERDRTLADFARTCSLCNDAAINFVDGRYTRMGMPTEAALKVLVEKLGVPGMDRAGLTPEEKCTAANAHWNAEMTRVATLEFSRDRKSMSVLARPAESLPQGRYPLRRRRSIGAGNTLFVKGAPESVLDRCTHVQLPSGDREELDDEMRDEIRSEVSDMSARALRCLAFATRSDLGELADFDGKNTHPSHHLVDDPAKFVNVEQDMTFVGLCGIRDPPRAEVRHSIHLCEQAGIRVMIITGDNKLTAESIARDIGVFGEDEDVERKSFTGRAFFALPEAEQRQILAGTGSRVFSRAEPVHKQRLVRLLKDADEVVAMTGDGVNDAPALKLADIGVAMGISGTEVAKEASDMILADDNFATIVAAVEEGRAIYQNMKAFIRYLISSNIGEVASIFLTAALGMPEGLIPVQLLWVNLVTDGPPATALGFNPPDPDIMTRPPRRADDSLITGWVFFRYMVIGAYVGFATVGIFAYWYILYDSPDGHTLVTWDQLTSWSKCHDASFFAGSALPQPFDGMDFGADPCSYFTDGKIKASTLSLSVLVTIEMFNALNALSEDGSLLVVPPWGNPWLLLAMAASFVLHFVILYVPFLASIFKIAPLTYDEWMLVIYFSLPVIFIDEILKFIGRVMNSQEEQLRKRKAE